MKSRSPLLLLGLPAAPGYETGMTLLTHRGHGPSFPYAGRPMHILAGRDGLPAGFAAMELTVPPHFAGPRPRHQQSQESFGNAQGTEVRARACAAVRP